MNNPIVIGIDPGSHTAGIAVVKGEELKSVRHVNFLDGKEYDDDDLAAHMVSFMLEIQDDIEKYDPVLLACEHTSVARNMHINKLLSYFEASALIAASMNNILVVRLRTTHARKIALGKNCKKDAAVLAIREKYGSELTNDEAEAIIFALAGVKTIQTTALMNTILP